ncbi:helix-turn-helix domain-containing protein [Cardinium endosymbiont of Oedothorax gibbosus]|uniref:helix-turn-helix domain-containing protein n=1 Tax=Cardinium endosymbiont of Oedothorax gibbosus TaxID=931101 RepID=UPI0020251850|nr:helix-turn-helix domain-containing protein [Cardinium endosymbiont of Oedothorax gibbosus]CAH2559858.1 DNA binding HTH Fis-type domain-containing protein [Cardinium endosymbiont of Oedothorax gibbosus]
MEQHKGKIVEEAIKKSGFRMKALAKKLGIARNTLYTRLKEADIKDTFIIEIGKIIYYDFSNDFPGIYEKNEPKGNAESPGYEPKGDRHEYIDESAIIRDPHFTQLQALNKKYLKLMEDYNKLLNILIILANDNELVGIKQEIMAFIENEKQED